MANSISGNYGYNNLMLDPYFWSALQSYNPNSAAAQQSQQAQQLIQAQQVNDEIQNVQAAGTGSTSPTFGSAASPLPQIQAGSDSGSSLLTGGALGAALTVGAMVLLKGKGGKSSKGILDGVKKFFDSKSAKTMSAFKFTTKNGSLLKVENGKIVSIEKATPKTLKDSQQVSTELQKRNITIPNLTDSKSLPEGVSLKSYTFNDKDLTINVKNGNIVKIIKSDGASISGKKALQDFFKKDKNLEKHLQQRVQNFQKGKGLNNVNELCYRYENGNLVYTNYNGSEWLRYPELTKLDKKGMQSWLEQNENVEKTVNEIIQKGKVNGVSRGSYVYTDAKKNKYYIDKDGNIEKIIIKSKGHDKIYNKGSDDFHSYLYEHKDVKEAIKKEYDAGFAADGTDTNFFEV